MCKALSEFCLESLLKDNYSFWFVKKCIPFDLIEYWHFFYFNFAVVEKEEGPNFSVNCQLLLGHFQVLFYELEPREIADKMLTTGHFSPNDHDSVTDLKNRTMRLQSLLNILERKQLYAPFLVVLESLGHTVVLETLKTERHFNHEPCKFSLFSILYVRY